MAGDGQGTAALGLGENLLEGQVDSAEVERCTQVLVDPKDEDMAVIGFDFAGLENQEAEFIFQGSVIRFIVIESMLGENEPSRESALRRIHWQ